MVFDASLWVSRFLSGDVHHARADRWLRRMLPAIGWIPVIPSLALPEIAGAIARRTGDRADGDEAVAELTLVPGLIIVPLDVPLAREAARTAARLKLRGADAVYATVAQMLDLPLVTFDQQLAEHAGGFVEVVLP